MRVYLRISASDKLNCQFALRLLLYGLGKKNFDYSRYNQQALEVMSLYWGGRPPQSSKVTESKKPYVMKLIPRLILSVGLVMLSLTMISSAAAQGPGTEMTQIINRLGLGSDCGRCKALAAEMDQLGPDGVLQNQRQIASRTIENASRLGHNMGPARRLGVRMIIRTSVRRSR